MLSSLFESFNLKKVGQGSGRSNWLVYRKFGALRDQSMEQKFSSNKINLINAQGQELNRMCTFLKNQIKEWHIEELKISRTNKPEIFCSIRNIRFIQLITLTLSRNSIQSIESIYKLHAPNVQNIYLSYNHISKVGGLHKINCESISQISLSHNKIINAEKLVLLEGMKLGTLFLEFFMNNQQCSDLTWIFKLQTKKLKKLRIESLARIRQNRALAKAEKKYGNIEIYEKNR